MWLAAGALLLGGLAAVPRGQVEASEAPATYSGKIAPILYRSCTSCHHPGGSGPFSLMTYADAKRWSGPMKDVTASRYMPPWLPEPGHGEFAGSRRLPDEDVALIRRWVDGGMPEGDAKEAPKPPVYASEWMLGTPDLVLEVDSPMEVPAEGTDLFRNFVLPVPITETRWVRAMEIKPGSQGVVHHANVLIDRTASLRRTHPADWKQGVSGMDVMLDAGDRFDPDGHFLEWKPDSTALVEQPGMPWRLDPGNDLVLNEHLKPTGRTEAVRARIGLYWAKDPAAKLPILVQLEHDAALDIPAGAKAFTVEDQMGMPVDVDALAIYPHAHYLGKRMEGWAVLPDGRREDLVLIANWDIDRQAIYRFQRPVFLPSGTVVHMRYTYDNSAANPHNPSSPPVRVRGGNRSADEMGHLWLQLLPRGEGDRRGPVLQAWMEARLKKDPNDPTALFNLASLAMNRGQPARAVELYERALAARPDSVQTEVALGTALVQTGDWQRARQRFQAAVEQDGTYADARYDLGAMDLLHEEFTDAERQFRALVAADADDVAARNGLGSALLGAGRTDEARVEFSAALKLDGRSFEALFNLARLEAAAGRSNEAIALLRRAEAERPGDADTHRGLAEMYAHAGQMRDAAREQETVVRLDGSHAEDWSQLGAIHAIAGNGAAAREDFQHALRLDANDERARNGLARL